MDTVIVKNLVKTFPLKDGRIQAVNNVSFSIKPGEIFGLLGVNGAGKSTIINILSGLTLPESGRISIFGKNLFQHEEEIKSRCNVATAYYHLSSHLTVLQNLRVYGRLYHVQHLAEKIAHLAAKFLIAPLLHTRMYSLSSGERSKVVLVKSLLNDPQLLFLDECTVGLDPDIAEITRDYLLEYNQKTGCTILFTSHYMQEVQRLCSRIAFMNQGKIIKIGPTATILKELNQQTVRLHFSQSLEQAKKILRQKKIRYQHLPGGVLEFKIKNQKKVIYPLLETFIRHNLPFDDLHLEKPTLEDYFIQQSRKKQ